MGRFVTAEIPTLRTTTVGGVTTPVLSGLSAYGLNMRQIKSKDQVYAWLAGVLIPEMFNNTKTVNITTTDSMGALLKSSYSMPHVSTRTLCGA